MLNFFRKRLFKLIRGRERGGENEKRKIRNIVKDLYGI